jgi:DNA (cytosine-5)-methyltransferase 1
VLWWEIERILRAQRPRHVFLENVDRLLKSPASQRGRDFAVMLACLAELGYLVEWRVVNAADYGFPQRRRRVFIVGERLDLRTEPSGDPVGLIASDGVLARALPVDAGIDPLRGADFALDGDLVELSDQFGGGRVSPFHDAGVMVEGKVWTRDVVPAFDGPRRVLADVLQPHGEVDERFFVRPDQVAAWRYLKGAKREERVHRASGGRYFYSEGAIAFPDPTDRPSRTILTGEGGSSASRFKHVIATADGRYRRLTPVELERLDGFPDGWTDTGMSDSRRAFMMGNALVVGLVERIGRQIARG